MSSETHIKTEQENYFIASSWTLMRRKFFKHRIAVIAGVILVFFYLVAIFAGFVAPYDKIVSRTEFAMAPPIGIHIFHDNKLQRPFVYGVVRERDPETLLFVYKTDRETLYPIKLFVKGDQYKFWGIFDANLHLFGVDDPGIILLFGADQLGRDIFSRVIYGGRISLSIGLVGVAISFILGGVFGGLSGLIGGAVDMAIQRVIEFLQSLPSLPMWMALAAALPVNWPTIRTYFLITVILSILGWTGLARIVRGKILQLREDDFVMAAKVSNSNTMRIILRHMLPNFIGYLIVHLTLAVPGMIIGETSLSFLGIGLKPPIVSWGVALQQATNIRTIGLYPWLLIPGIFVVVTVLCFNSVGDGLRDAADPYK